MPEARQRAGAGKFGQNWNDQAAQGKPGLCQSAYDQPLARRTGGDRSVLWQQRADPLELGRALVGILGHVQNRGKGAPTGEEAQPVALGFAARQTGRLRMDEPAAAPNAPTPAVAAMRKLRFS